jgi:hypothetical protein
LQTTTSQNVDNETPRINGGYASDDLKFLSDRAEALLNSADVSVSGGSDTEAAKADTSKGTGDEKGHTRSTSTVKKPTSFKPVSVNKTFLAAKGAAPAKPGDKAPAGASATLTPGSTSAAPRPRLVAKTASSLRDAGPRTATAANGKTGSGPDANAVWNKNRRTLEKLLFQRVY